MVSSIDQVKNEIEYNPETGLFKWKIINHGRREKGWFRGTLSGCGYLKIMILGVRHATHRIAWAITFGEWPENDIDHINGDRTDNRIKNLRSVTRTENCHNYKKPKTNTSGFWALGSARGINCGSQKFASTTN